MAVFGSSSGSDNEVLVIGGLSKFLCIYDLKRRILIERLQFQYN